MSAGSCTSELQLKVNCRPKVNCRKKFGLVCQLLAESVQILSCYLLSVYNSLSAEIHLYIIRAYISGKKKCVPPAEKIVNVGNIIPDTIDI